MKKLLALLFVFTAVFALSACNGEEEVETGNYEPGMYFGYTEGHRNTIAVLFVDENGFISDIFVDTAYDMTVDEELVSTTKMSLDGGCGYHMHRAKEVEYDADGNCFVDGEMMWHEQVQAIIDAIIEAQEIPAWDIVDNEFDFEDGDDVVAGVTITIDGYLDAIEAALTQAQE